MDESDLLARQQRRNRIWLTVLIALALAMALLSFVLFNKYWDPFLSSETISH